MAVAQEKLVEGRIQWASVVRFSRAAFQNRIVLFFGFGFLALGAFSWTATSGLAGMLADRIFVLAKVQGNLRSDPQILALMFGIFAALYLMYLGNRFGRMWINQSFIQALTRVHNDAVLAVFKTDMHFFNTTPTGRIISRFAGDYFNAGNSFDRVMATFVYSVFATLFSAAYVIYAQSTMLLLAVPFCVALFFLSRFYGARARDTQRQTSRSNAVTLGHFSESFSTILAARGLGILPRIAQRLETLQRDATALNYKTLQLTNWRVLTQSFVALGLVAGSLLYSIHLVQKGELSVGQAGSSITLLMLILRNFLLIVELFNTLEVGFTSVERLNEFAELSPEELPLSAPSTAQQAPFIQGEADHFSISSPEILQSQVPSADAVPMLEFRNLQVRYAPHLPLVLAGLTEKIAHREKIGLVGRTGSGKTTLVQALFRMVELQPQQLFLDGDDITALPLAQLRGYFGVVPQEPVLFVGSLLENVAPQGANLESPSLHATVEKALGRVKLLDWVHSLPEGIHAPVLERGANLSHGQRQLLCLARALAKEPRILILDEATSAVDPDTEQLVDEALQTATQNLTSIIIAHRLSTIEKCDRILLLRDGKILERGTPHELMNNPNSHYSALRGAALRTGGVIV